ncbi:hypothetical protein DRP77_10590 [Candidatus Poribacteria bacterium]|nr:MAG: hypothetical protein DRP77_10590 [Candidatus Poribacteria bacterium]
MAEKRRRVFWPVLSAVLIVGLAVMIVLYVQMLVFINRLVGMVVDLVEREVLAEAPEGVDKAKIKETFEKVKWAIPRGKVDFGKVRAAAAYAQKARSDDDGWTAEEIDTFIEMLNAALGPGERR